MDKLQIIRLLQYKPIPNSIIQFQLTIQTIETIAVFVINQSIAFLVWLVIQLFIIKIHIQYKLEFIESAWLVKAIFICDNQ